MSVQATEKEQARHNHVNERVKYKYRKHLCRALKRDEKTVDACLKNIRRFEVFIEFSEFNKFNNYVADKYIQSLFNADLSLSYISDNIRYLKDFLKWLERQQGYRSAIYYDHIDYLNISQNQRKAAKAQSYQKVYKFEEIIQTIRQMPSASEREKRDKAIISLQALCALRISELRTVKIGSLIEEDGCYFIYVSPKNMDTKFAKTRHVNFIPLPYDIVENVLLWRDYLISVGFKDSDPLFPRVDNQFNQSNLLERCIKKDEIKSGTTMRGIFKRAFEGAGFKYINPHSFRKTLARYAQTQSPAFLNAIRQNLGHASIDTTLNSYGQLSVPEQRKVIVDAEIGLSK